MLAGSCICGTISKYQNGMSKVARKTFNIGEVWNPVILGRSGTHGNKTVELVLWSTFSRILLQRISISDTNWLRYPSSSYLIPIWLNVRCHHFQGKFAYFENLNISGTKREI